MVVSANTLYQEISPLFAALRTVGENEDTLIITSFRVRGFQIEHGVSLMTIRKRLRFRTIERVRRRHGYVRALVLSSGHMPVLWWPGTFALSVFCLAYKLANRSR